MNSLMSHFLTQANLKKTKAALILFTVLITSTAIKAGDKGRHGCATSDLAGKWMFYTDVGHGLPSLDKLTALGTMNFNKAGELEGVFDVNTEEGPFLDLSYTGNATLNSDCRGRLTFITSDGAVRNDSFVLIGKNKIRGIPVQTDVIWTYTAERISRRSNN